tara:strand:- start:68 stop:796 length:729 start_codon:yes stop_codon:yes gene_type:complete
MEQLLQEEYNKLDECERSSLEKFNIINNIIQIKLDNIPNQGYNNDITIDIKKMINYHIQVGEEAPLNYDSIKAKKFGEMISIFPIKDKLLLIDYFLRQLEKSAFKNEIKEFQKLKSELTLRNSISTFSLNSFLNIIILFPLHNIFFLLVTVLFIGFLTGIILLPEINPFFGVLDFKLNYTQIAENKFINHFLNVCGYLSGLDDDFLKPLNSTTYASIIIGKFIMFIYVSCLIVNKLTEYIKR